MSAASQPRRQTQRANRKLRFPANMPMLMNGVIRHSERGFELEIDDLDELKQPMTQAIPIARSATEMELRIEEYVDQAVTIEGRWLPDPHDATEAGCVQVTALSRQPPSVTAIDEA